MQQAVTCPSCGSQNATGQQFCTICGTRLPSEGQQQVGEAQPTPAAPPVTRGAVLRQKYVFLGAAAIIFKIVGWIVLVAGILGSVAVAVMAAQGAMPKLTNLLDRGMEIVGVSGVAGAGLAVVVFGGIVGSLVCGLGFLAFAELCSVVTAIDENTKLQE